MATMHGVAVGSVMLSPMRLGPAGSATVSPSGSMPSPVTGSKVEVGRLRRVALAFVPRTVMQYPLTSRMQMVTGQMMSMLSPRDPAKIASVPLAVGNGQERTAKVGLAPGTLRRNAIWLTRVDSQSLASLVVSGKVLENVAAMRFAFSTSGT